MHRERPLDFWLTTAAVVSLFVPIWGVLLAPSEMISVPMYLAVLGIPALLVIIGALVYAKLHNKIFLNRFLIGYLGGLAGTLVIQIFLSLGTLFNSPNLVYHLGNLALGRGFSDTPSTGALLIGMAFHYLLNGAAWGAVYALLFGKAQWWYGLFYGAAIWAVLMISPVFYRLDQPSLSPGMGLILIASTLVGHLAYGGTIGYVVYRYVYPEVGIEGAKAVRPNYA